VKVDKKEYKSKKMSLPEFSTATYGGALSGMGEKFIKERKRLEKLHAKQKEVKK